MTARDDLRTALLQGWERYNPERADLLIDAFAHELAEQIRAETLNYERWAGPGTEHSRGTRNAATLIDPEVTP